MSCMTCSVRSALMAEYAVYIEKLDVAFSEMKLLANDPVELERVTRRVDDLWHAYNEALHAFEQHVHEHGCKYSSREASA